MTKEMAEADIFMASLAIVGGLLCLVEGVRLTLKYKAKASDKRRTTRSLAFAIFGILMFLSGATDLIKDWTLLKK